MRTQDILRLIKNVVLMAVAPYIANWWLCTRFGEVLFSIQATCELTDRGVSAFNSFFLTISSPIFLVTFSVILGTGWLLAMLRLDHKPHSTTSTALIASRLASPLCRAVRILCGMFIPPFSILLAAKTMLGRTAGHSFNDDERVLIIIMVLGVISQFFAEYHDLSDASRLRPGAREIDGA